MRFKTRGSHVRGKHLLAMMAVALTVAACTSAHGSTDHPTATTPTSGGLLLQGPTAPTEYVGLTTQIPIDRATFDAVSSRLFGAAAARGTYLPRPADRPGAAPLVGRAPHQRRPGRPDRHHADDRRHATHPHGHPRPRLARRRCHLHRHGDATLAQVEKIGSSNPTRLAPFRLEDRSTSASGGKLTLAVVFDPGAGPT